MTSAAAQAESPSAGIEAAPSGPPNPYVGPRPFTPQESGRFFGRDLEANQLLSLVIAERLVLFYAQSGAGKSSLINARLIPGLVERNFQVLNGRVSGQTLAEGQGAGGSANIFTHNLLLSLEHSLGRDSAENAQRLAGMTLAQYLSDLSIEAEIDPGAPSNGGSEGDSDGDFRQLLDAPQIFSGVRPLALIIDQFEEIFTTNPAAWRQRKPFFDQLCEAMQQDPYLWVVLVIREDYVAALDPFANLLPGRMRARFYMQRMGYGAALEAVTRPVASLRPFEPDAAEELVSNLSLIQTGKDAENQPIYAPGQYIEPVQLQVVCFQLWEALRSDPHATITRENLHSLTAGKNLASFISDALALFYTNALEEVRRQYPDISERKLRDFFSNELITEAETRGAVVEGKERTGSPPNDLPNAVVHALQSRFVIRAEIRGENTWYELSHDRFVAPILQSNRKWAEDNPFPVEAAARKWVDSGRDNARLYDGQQLKSALVLLANSPDELSETARQFIRASQEVARNKERRRQRVAFGVLSSLLVLAVVLAFVAMNNARVATQQRGVADEQRATAELASTLAIEQRVLAETASTAVVQQREVAVEQRTTAEAASTIAIEQRNLAEVASTQEAQQRALAVEQRATAEAASTLAVRQEAIAKTAEAEAQFANVQSQASRLASLADFFRVPQPNLSMLLAMRAVNVFDNWESRGALLDTIQHGLASQVVRSNTYFLDDDRPNTIAFSPDGRYLAAGLDNGLVRLFGVDGQTANRTLPQERSYNAPVLAITFNDSGDTLAIVGEGRDVLLWRIGDTAAQDAFETFPAFPITDFYYTVRVAAFQPGGSYLALGTNQATEAADNSGRVLLFDLNDLEGGPKHTELCEKTNCTALAWSPDGTRLAFGDGLGNLKVLRVEQGSAPSIAWNKGRAHTALILGLVWYNDNQRFASGGIDRRLYQWDTKATTNVPLRTAAGEGTPTIFSLAISPSGRYIVAGSSDGGSLLTIWDAETLERKQYAGLENPHTHPIMGVAFSRQGTRFASAASDNFINLWSFNPIDALSSPAGSVTAPGRALAVGADASGSRYVFKALPNQGALWKQEAADKQAQLFTVDEAISGAVLQPYGDGVALVLGSADGRLRVLGADGQALVEPLLLAQGQQLRAVAASPDLKLLAASACTVGGGCGQILLSDGAGGAPRAIPFSGAQGESINALSLSPDGAVLAVGTSEGRILIYNAQTLERIGQAVTEGMRLGSFRLSVTSLAYSPQEAGLLMAGFSDGRVAMWDARNVYPVGVFDEREVGQMNGLGFTRSPEKGWTLLSVSEAGEVRRWEVDRDAWIARGCQKLQSAPRDIDERASALYPDTTVAGVCP